MPFKFSFIYMFHFFPLSCNDTCYQMNASSKLGPLSLVVPIYGWLMPFVFILTLISNSLIIMVLSRSVDNTSLSLPPNIHMFTLGPSMFSIFFHKVEISNCSPHQGEHAIRNKYSFAGHGSLRFGHHHHSCAMVSQQKYMLSSSTSSWYQTICLDISIYVII